MATRVISILQHICILRVRFSRYADGMTLLLDRVVWSRYIEISLRSVTHLSHGDKYEDLSWNLGRYSSSKRNNKCLGSTSIASHLSVTDLYDTLLSHRNVNSLKLE
jgi:hypothetical protein